MPIWNIFETPLEYEPTIQAMNMHVKAMQEGSEQEAIWLLSHDAVYTGGTSAQDRDILQKQIYLSSRQAVGVSGPIMMRVCALFTLYWI